MAGNWGDKHIVETVDYGKEYMPQRPVKVIKKDGSTETFNVQKVISAVGTICTTSGCLICFICSSSCILIRCSRKCQILNTKACC